MGFKNIVRVQQVVFGPSVGNPPLGTTRINTPARMQSPGDAPRLEIDPSSPVLIARIYNSPNPGNNPMQEGYMLLAGDSLELEPGTREVFIAPHSNVPTPVVIRQEASIPLVGFRPREGDRVDRPVKPTYYRLRDYVDPVTDVNPGPVILSVWRIAVPLWDAVRLQLFAAYGGITAGTVQVDGEMMDEAGNIQTTPLLAPAAVPAGASMQFVRIGDIADPNANMPWARVTLTFAGIGTYSISMAAELLRIVNAG